MPEEKKYEEGELDLLNIKKSLDQLNSRLSILVNKVVHGVMGLQQSKLIGSEQREDLEKMIKEYEYTNYDYMSICKHGLTNNYELKLVRKFLKTTVLDLLTYIDKIDSINMLDKTLKKTINLTLKFLKDIIKTLENMSESDIQNLRDDTINNIPIKKAAVDKPETEPKSDVQPDEQTLLDLLPLRPIKFNQFEDIERKMTKEWVDRTLKKHNQNIDLTDYINWRKEKIKSNISPYFHPPEIIESKGYYHINFINQFTEPLKELYAKTQKLLLFFTERPLPQEGPKVLQFFKAMSTLNVSIMNNIRKALLNSIDDQYLTHIQVQKIYSQLELLFINGWKGKETYILNCIIMNKNNDLKDEIEYFLNNWFKSTYKKFVLNNKAINNFR